MSNKNHKKPNITDAAMHEKMRRALIGKGWLIPTTPEEVKVAEDAGLDSSSQLPASLSDPMSILDNGPRVPKPIAGSIPDQSPSETQQYLARAAREGKEISPELAARMKADREAAERDADK